MKVTTIPRASINNNAIFFYDITFQSILKFDKPEGIYMTVIGFYRHQ